MGSIIESANEHAIAYEEAEAIAAATGDVVAVANEYALAVEDVEDILADNPAAPPPAEGGTTEEPAPAPAPPPAPRGKKASSTK